MTQWKILQDPGPSLNGPDQPWVDINQTYDDVNGDINTYLQNLQETNNTCYAAESLVGGIDEAVPLPISEAQLTVEKAIL